MRSFNADGNGWKPVAVTVGLPLMLVSVQPAAAVPADNRLHRPGLKQLSTEELRRVHAQGVGDRLVRLLEAADNRDGDVELDKLSGRTRRRVATLTRRVQERLPNQLSRMVQYSRVDVLERQLRAGFRLNDLLDVDKLRSLVKGLSRTIGALTQPRFRVSSSQSRGNE